MLQEIELPTLSITKEKYFTTKAIMDNTVTVNSWDIVSSPIEESYLGSGYCLATGIEAIADFNVPSTGSVISVSCSLSTIPQSFEIVSIEKEAIYFKDLITEKTRGVLPKKLYQKLKQALIELKDSEPGLYEYLKEINKEIDVDQLVCILEFIGASTLPKGIDSSELLSEVKTSSVNASEILF